MILVYLFALSGAFLLAVGFVIQQHVAREDTDPAAFSLLLLVHLARRPLWLAGIGSMVGGQILGAIALSKGSLTLVEPLLAANLLFALPLSAAWRRMRLGLREYGGAILLLVGLAGFIAATGPSKIEQGAVPPLSWVAAALVVGTVVAVLTTVAKRLRLAGEATLLATSAGILFGLQDAVTQSAVLDLDGSLSRFLHSWPPYAVIVIAISGLGLGQNAFKDAPLPASLPAITIAEPVCGVAIGAGLLGEHVRLTWPFASLEALTLLFMVVGVLLVARSPVVTGTHAKPKV